MILFHIHASTIAYSLLYPDKFFLTSVTKPIYEKKIETLLRQVKIVKKLWKTIKTERWLDLQTFEHFHLKIGQNNFQNKILFCWIVNCSWYSGDSMSRWALSFLNSLTYYALANNLTFFEGQPAQHVAQHPHIWAWGIFENFNVFFCNSSG